MEKIIILIKDLKQNNLNIFPRIADYVQEHQNYNYNIEKHVAEIKKVIQDIEIRFHGFGKIIVYYSTSI